MAEAMREIVLITFRFPPMGGIGARRWTKFCKYLSQRQNFLHVVTVDYPHVDENNLLMDIEGRQNIRVHRLKNYYPVWMLRAQKGVLGKVFYRIFDAIFIKNVYYLDPVQRWARQVIPYVNNLVRARKICTVIASGPPHSLFYHAAFVKVENPNIQLILDYRDPWGELSYSSYKSGLKYFWQKERQVNMEVFSLIHADKVFLATEGMRRNLSAVYKEFSKKFYTINNGFDTDDYISLERKNKYDSISIIYPGTFGPENRLLGVKMLAESIHRMRDQLNKHKLSINFYSHIKRSDFKTFQYVNIIDDYFRFHRFIDHSELLEKINEHAFCLSINGPNDSHAFGTKVYDYMALKKRIILISNGGELYDMLHMHGHVVAQYDLISLTGALYKIKHDFENSVNYSYDFIGSFDLNLISDKINSLL